MLLPKDRSHSQNRSGWTLVSNESRAPVVQLTPGQPLYTHTRPSLGLAVVPTLRSQVPLWSSLRKLLSFWATGRPLFCAPFSVSWGFFLCRGLEILPSTACNFLWSTVPGPLAHDPRKGLRPIPKLKKQILLQEIKAFTPFHHLSFWVETGSGAGQPVRLPASPPQWLPWLWSKFLTGQEADPSDPVSCMYSKNAIFYLYRT